MTDFQAEKKKYLTMPLNEKRKTYLVSKYIPLDEILKWPDYFIENINRLTSDTKKKIIESSSLEGKVFTVELSHLVSLFTGDITQLEIDGIVNAANEKLLGGGGVDGAIHRAAGPQLLEECRTLHGCQTGDAKITGGYKLPAKYVIHTVGPRIENPKLLESCYEKSLKHAIENNIRSIAFPCISTGIFNYPRLSAANTALNKVQQFLAEHPSKFDRVIFTLFTQEDVEIYEALMQVYFPNR